MREYLDSVIKADQCAKYVDVIGIAANNTQELIRNIKAVFECIRRAGLKLTIEKCSFGLREIEFLGRTISPDGVAPQAHKIRKFLEKQVNFPKSKKVLQRFIGFVNYTTGITFLEWLKKWWIYMTYSKKTHRTEFHTTQ